MDEDAKVTVVYILMRNLRNGKLLTSGAIDVCLAISVLNAMRMCTVKYLDTISANIGLLSQINVTENTGFVRRYEYFFL